ncbi:hypothetical protein [Barnesiella intestinihominis]|uniref:hypothetical protein n=1 Tax=Barnesiella intestinihominis TaxID=487174 RepID=UPI003569F5DA
MKKILLLTAAVLISGSAMAQHEHFHVFRNDKQFNTFNNVQEITYQGSPSSGYDKMQVTDAKGKYRSYRQYCSPFHRDSRISRESNRSPRLDGTYRQQE